MIGRLRGTLVDRQSDAVLVDCGGVGYQAAVSLQTFAALPGAGSEVVLLVVTVLRENALELFAFASEEERRAFGLLRSVSGIGPRMALAVLSGISTDELAAAVSSGDAARLTRIPGIGRKTAERMIVDLRGKLDAPAPAAQGGPDRLVEDALAALTGLGYRRPEAEMAVEAAREGSDGTLEDLLRRSLAGLARTGRH